MFRDDMAHSARRPRTGGGEPTGEQSDEGGIGIGGREMNPDALRSLDDVGADLQ